MTIITVQNFWLLAKSVLLGLWICHNSTYLVVSLAQRLWLVVPSHYLFTHLMSDTESVYNIL